jgi:hypothetical protein
MFLFSLPKNRVFCQAYYLRAFPAVNLYQAIVFSVASGLYLMRFYTPWGCLVDWHFSQHYESIMLIARQVTRRALRT